MRDQFQEVASGLHNSVNLTCVCITVSFRDLTSKSRRFSFQKPGRCHVQYTTAKMPESLKSVLSKCYDEYVNNTPKKLKIVDAYLAYIMLTGIMQFVYCCLVGTFPFNSFLSGFISCVGSFVLGGMFSQFHAVFWKI